MNDEEVEVRKPGCGRVGFAHNLCVANLWELGLLLRVPQSFTACRRLAQFLGMVCVVWLACGCATNKVNWDSRVGRASYDEIVLEMGPPDKSATLSDGTVVGEWVVVHGRTHAVYNPTLYHFRRPYFYGGLGTTVDLTESPDAIVRLTFGADKRLTAWKRLYR